MPDVAVVGGGITGLAAAWALRGRAAVTVLERDDRLGGKISTRSLSGVPVEAGPDTFLARQPDAVELCRSLGLGDDLVAPANGKAWIWTGGRLSRLPEPNVLGVPLSLRSVLRSPLLSASGKSRALADLVLPGSPRSAAEPDPSVAEVVGRRLASWPRKRVTLAELEAVVVAERPELNASVALGTRLAEVVDAVVAAGVVKPSSRRTRFRGVALPVILTRPAAERPRPERPALRHPWRADLAWAGETEGATFEHLRVLDRWLTADPAPAPAPVKERSLEIWGDEKLLDRLRRGPWGQRLPEALALFVVHPPLVIEAISDAAGGLLVENATTWRSLVTAGREHVAAGVPTSIGWIAYGAGNQVAAAVPGLAGHRPDRLWYFGDLDARGLSFAAAAARAAA
ncbi:MAG: FAD-dependent oxidoreductase, partial [Acidimicrobiales bacterium]